MTDHTEQRVVREVAGWRIEFVVATFGLSSPAIREMHIRPVGDMPEGGLTARGLQAVRFDPDIYAEASIRVGCWRGREPDMADIRYQATHNPGRRGHPDSFYAAVANAYLIYVSAGSRTPTADLAAELELAPNRVRDLVRAARRRGLLTDAPRGRAGGRILQDVA